LKKRTKHALKLRKKGLSFIKIGQELGIGSERARQIVRKHQRHLKAMEDPFALKNKELSRFGEATRIVNALKENGLYHGESGKLADFKLQELMKIRGLGRKSIGVIAWALESMGLITDAEECLKVWGLGKLPERVE